MNNRHTIGSGIVKDVLVELVKSGMNDKYLGGGLGAQFYLPKEFHRQTADLDMDSNKLISAEYFRTFLEGIFIPLKQRGYSLDTKKERGTFDAYISRDNSQLILQMCRRSQKKFDELKPRLEREVANAEEISYAEGSLRVINVNDLISRKLGRANMFSREYNLHPQLSLSSVDYLDLAKSLIQSSDFSLMHPHDSSKVIANIRLLCDLADIKALKEVVPSKVDEKYLNSSLEDFPTKDRESLFRFYSQVFTS